jgi:hypothetical protein
MNGLWTIRDASVTVTVPGRVRKDTPVSRAFRFAGRFCDAFVTVTVPGLWPDEA